MNKKLLKAVEMLIWLLVWKVKYMKEFGHLETIVQ